MTLENPKSKSSNKMKPNNTKCTDFEELRTESVHIMPYDNADKFFKVKILDVSRDLFMNLSASIANIQNTPCTFF